MTKRSSAVLRLATLLALGATMCGGEPVEVTNDTGTGEDGGGDASETGDGSEDGTGEIARAGPLTFVVRDAQVLTDRLCDLDGNGVGDNAIADLGEPGASILRAAISSLLGGPITRDRFLLVHFPWVDDVSAAQDPETSVVFLYGIDADDPPDPTDDFSGEEPLLASPKSLDECMEPLGGTFPTSLDNGAFTANGVIRLTPGSPTETLLLDGARLEGAIDRIAGSAIISACGYMSAAEIGSISAGSFFGAQEASLLEVLLAGGESIGIPGVPGIRLDVDVDGDGLERILLDAAGHVESCIDGDRSEVPGALCWRDARIADGISLVVQFDAVSARLADLGRAAGLALLGGCDGGPPQPSAWGPCPNQGTQLCERYATRECNDACERPGLERCEWDCAGWAPCVPAATDRLAATSCEGLLLGGSVCDGVSLETVIVSGPAEVGGIQLPERVTVGRGPITIDARARVARATSAEPGIGWAVTASLENSGSWIGDASSLGVDSEAIGYTTQWHFGRVLPSSQEADFILVAGLYGAGSSEVFRLVGGGTSRGQEPLDTETEGSVEQHLRMVIVPNLPETDEDETAVGGFMVVDGVASLTDGGCLPGQCPLSIETGDTLTIALTASTSADRDAVVEVSLPDGLTVGSDPPCP